MNRLDALPAPGQSLHGVIAGRVGEIECLIAMPRDRPRGLAITCHPHPLFGGAMSNKVTYTLASTALKLDLVSLRFNFRGVGQSQGKHDSARGETDDCVFLAQWLRAQRPDLPLLLSGFSFGAFVSLNAASRAGASALVSIAPPFGRYLDGAPRPPHPGCPWLTVHSRDDDTVSFDETRDVLNSYQPAPEQIVVDGAGHFFHGQLNLVQDAARPFFERYRQALDP